MVTGEGTNDGRVIKLGGPLNKLNSAGESGLNPGQKIGRQFIGGPAEMVYPNKLGNCYRPLTVVVGPTYKKKNYVEPVHVRDLAGSVKRTL